MVSEVLLLGLASLRLLSLGGSSLGLSLKKEWWLISSDNTGVTIEQGYIQLSCAFFVYLLGSLLLLLGRGSSGSLILLFVSLQDEPLSTRVRVSV